MLVTQASDFVGPALVRAFAAHGAEVIADSGPLLDARRPAEIIAATGRIDVVIANLACPAPSTLATESSDDEWRSVFACLVDPLPRPCRAVLSQLLERKSGKIIVMGSAAALRGIRRASTYSAARSSLTFGRSESRSQRRTCK